jgi:PPM family protein phosphatase
VSQFRSASLTDVGRKRDHNEDSFLVNEELGLYVVCDGMGGHAGGETASRLAVLTIERDLISTRLREDDPFDSGAPLSDTPLAGALREAIEGACAAVFRTARLNPQLAGMGTTAISFLFQGEIGLLGHVGDSRGYALRDGAVTQLSEDHSLVNEQVRAGLLTSEEARHSRLKNIITRSVGFEEDVLVDLIGFHTQKGDKYLLCSDGLANLVDTEEIRDCLVKFPLADVPRELIALANDRGGDDNITVVAVERVE